MPVLALGVSHRAASVDLLERLAVTADAAPKSYRRLLDLEPVAEGVILSTCNRVEVYAEVASYHAGFLALKRFMAETGEMDPDEFAEPLYAHYEEQAADHLFGVAAGMDSMVLGEPQILSQVRAAVRTAQAEEAAGPVLEPLFRAAVRAGRRVRAETAIGSAPEAMVVAGLDLASLHLGGRGVDGRRTVVVGAGEMAALAVRVLRQRGAAEVRIVNRTPERAHALAERHGAEAHGLHALDRALAGAQLVVTCTGAAGFVVSAEDVAAARSGHEEEPLFVVDLAVPRDVDPGVAALPGVTVVNVDDLGAGIRSGRGARASIETGAVVVAEEVARYAARRRAARLAPLITGLRERADGVRSDELMRAAPRLASLTPKEREAVEALTRSIVAKLLHEPIVRTKERADSSNGDLYARVLADLFGLDVTPGP